MPQNDRSRLSSVVSSSLVCVCVTHTSKDVLPSRSLSCERVGTNDTERDLPKHGWAFRRIALPVLGMLRLGASPERLAWSLALGVVIGINPVLGSTTLVCLALASVLRLNIAASQLANHLVYPLELMLLVPFLRLGALVFRSGSLPLSPSELLHQARTRPMALTRELWVWELHALLAWLLLAAVVAPAIALALTPLLGRMQARVEQHRLPTSL